ncbi:MAG: HEAT repeat domain-containing protein [Alphaproteobacteria bacterium]
MLAKIERTDLVEDRAVQQGEVCARLCEILRGGVDVHRVAAARALGRIGDSDAVAALVSALLDEDEDVRTDAAAALGQLGDPAAAPKLLENLLGDPCTDVKQAALESLISLRSESVAPWLVRLVRGRDEEIAWDDTDLHETDWDDWTDMQVTAIEGLAEFGAVESVPEIVAAIADEFGQDLTDVGFPALARLGRDGVTALTAYLDSKDTRPRRRAAAILAASNAPAAIAGVTRALRDRAAEVRGAAFRALAARAPLDPRLMPFFVDRQPVLRAEAVRLLGKNYPSRVAVLLKDSAREVLLAVLGLIAESPRLFEAADTGDLLRQRITHDSDDVAAFAVKARAAIEGAGVLDDLIALLADKSRPVVVRSAAADGLKSIGGAEAVAALAAVLDADTRQLRLDAMAALAALAAESPDWPNPAGETLLAALRGELVPEPEVVEEDEPAGVEEEPPEPEEAETDVFHTSTLRSIEAGAKPLAPDVSEESIEITPEDEEYLTLSQKRAMRKRKVSPNPTVAAHEDVPRFAARLLGDIARADVALALAQSLGGRDEEVRLAAIDSLARIAEDIDEWPEAAIDAVFAIASHDDRDFRLPAVRALGAAGDERAGAVLRERLADEDGFVRAEAIRALSRLELAGAEIAGLLGDPEPNVRLAAAQAVAAARDAGVVDLLTDFAFHSDGYHGGDVARLLREIDPAAASARFLDALDDPDRMRVWQVAIEALAELNNPGTIAGKHPRREIS